MNNDQTEDLREAIRSYLYYTRWGHFVAGFVAGVAVTYSIMKK